MSSRRRRSRRAAGAATSNCAAEEGAPDASDKVEKRLREAAEDDGEQDAAEREGLLDVFGDGHRTKTSEELSSKGLVRGEHLRGVLGEGEDGDVDAALGADASHVHQIAQAFPFESLLDDDDFEQTKSKRGVGVGEQPTCDVRKRGVE